MPHATNVFLNLSLLSNPSTLVITGDEGGGCDDDEMLSKGMVKIQGERTEMAIADAAEGESKWRELDMLWSFHLILWKKKQKETTKGSKRILSNSEKKMRKGELIEARDSTASVQVLKGIKLIVRGKGEMAI
ncbi:hypothetical protein SLEP1_g43865 [Rubroshorea leprosula]|uniref:Uncharacterized protein n=1 Tax=Rubroshorea leprosula TaxID=152421 RepID=A0AAV5LF68_9ROSI|nr:hypothetical protein SLEP1_g43865 [Rubroshorea leprosula]